MFPGWVHGKVKKVSPGSSGTFNSMKRFKFKHVHVDDNTCNKMYCFELPGRLFVSSANFSSRLCQEVDLTFVEIRNPLNKNS